MSSHLERPRSNTLGGSFFGLFVEVWVISNSYPKLFWPTEIPPKSMQLENNRDVDEVSKWASRIRGVRGYKNTQVTEEIMRGILRRCSKEAPTILYLGGHTMDIQGEKTYLPADCSDVGKDIPSKGISFTEISNLLVSRKKAQPLLLVTDACDFTNLLKLPFVLRRDGGRGYWEKTEHCVEGSSNMKQHVLHFASTKPGEASYGFDSAGGIFTRAFCNIAVDEEMNLAERSAAIQADIDDFMRKYSEMHNSKSPINQQHQIYSSEELNLDDKNLFESFRFFCEPMDSPQAPKAE